MSWNALRWARGVRRISSTQKLVLVMLADQANDYGECWPSAIALAEDCCLTDRSVRAALEALERQGLIEGDRRPGRATRWRMKVGSTPEPAAGLPEQASATPEARSETPERRSVLKEIPSTPEGGSGEVRNVVPDTLEGGSDRSIKNHKMNHKEPSVRLPPSATTRGTRLPEYWRPSPEDQGFACSRGLDAAAIADNFRDYWHARAGAGGVKRDWSATWRNWCRREAERARAGPNAGRGPVSRRAMAMNGASAPAQQATIDGIFEEIDQ